MPAYNEEKSILAAIGEVKSSLEFGSFDYEVIVVDDGSSDKTKFVASELDDGSTLKVVGYQKNEGKGYALRYGAGFSTGDVLIFMDSDLEISSSRLDELVASLGDADFSVASKRHPDSHVKSPGSRVFLSLGFNVLVRLLTGVKIGDTQSGLKAMRTDSLKRVLRLLSVKKYAFDVELLTVANLLGMKIVEFPVELDLKTSGFKLESMMRMLIDLLGIAYRLRLTGWYHQNLREESVAYQPRLRW